MMRTHRRIAVAVALPFALTMSAPHAQTETCRHADEKSGVVEFSVLQSDAPFKGRFQRFKGSLCMTESHVTRLDVTLDAASATMGLPEIDAALVGADFLAAAQYPQIIFASRAIDARAE